MGFYREYGGAVTIVGYRDVIKREWVVKPREVRVWVPEYYEDRQIWVEETIVQDWVLVPEHIELETRTVEAGWAYSQVWVEGEWVARRYWIEEFCEYQEKTVRMSVLGVMRDVTRNVLVCEPAHWGERKEWIPGQFREVSHWEDEYEETFEVKVRTHYEMQDIVIPGHFKPDRVLVPGEWLTEMVESGAWEDVVYQEPVYSYVGSVDEYCLVELQRAGRDPPDGEVAADTLELRYTGSNEWITVEAEYVSLAQSIGGNVYV